MIYNTQFKEALGITDDIKFESVTRGYIFTKYNSSYNSAFDIWRGIVIKTDNSFPVELGVEVFYEFDKASRLCEHRPSVKDNDIFVITAYNIHLEPDFFANL